MTRPQPPYDKGIGDAHHEDGQEIQDDRDEGVVDCSGWVGHIPHLGLRVERAHYGPRVAAPDLRVVEPLAGELLPEGEQGGREADGHHPDDQDEGG